MNKVYLIWYDNGYVCVLDAITTTEKLAKEYIEEQCNSSNNKHSYYKIEPKDLWTNIIVTDPLTNLKKKIYPVED